MDLDNNILLIVPRGKCSFTYEQWWAGRRLVLWRWIYRTRPGRYGPWRRPWWYRSTGRTCLIYYGFGVICLYIILLFNLVLLTIRFAPLILCCRFRPRARSPCGVWIPFIIYLVLTEIETDTNIMILNLGVAIISLILKTGDQSIIYQLVEIRAWGLTLFHINKGESSLFWFI